eukprot:CAMPEP_0201119108 /NCGR_PEP_ID=MMETSP0850-20130426/3295_1 /ASSEMBLY_ACC=CAM_ASM_000622 /TAXON_ID=183588 /ORGANISM="Pseudo-nitzschia fraudulenta, Strain WWA7" /LENGTH=301 /DNA_ID=CAMNT_0047384691 /DNA_START=171 /DNA_END=1073 /DNA_ORIENTATION=-
MLPRVVFFAQLLPVLFQVFGSTTTLAFTSPSSTRTPPAVGFSSPSHSSSVIVLNAGGFEWEDPTDEQFDQGVDNPFKNPELMKSIKQDGGDDDDDSKTIDPARLLGPRLQGSNLYLVGMMGSGKSSVGDKLARRMGSYKFLDTDDIIEKATKVSIPDIFEAEGEDGFRDVESQVLDTVHSYVRCVVSTGGGLVCRPKNWGKLQTGIVIWLDVAPEVIIKRIEGNDDRPLLKTEDPLQTLKDLLEERESKYSQADFRVEITEDMDEDTVASKIVMDLHNYIDDNPPAWKLAKQKAQEEGLDW